MESLYSAFVYSEDFKKSVEEIPHKAIRKAIWHYGIGDSLTRLENGNFFYNLEEGNLIEPEVRDLLEVIEEEEYQANYNAICAVGTAYEKWANEQKNEEKPGSAWRIPVLLEISKSISKVLSLLRKSEDLKEIPDLNERLIALEECIREISLTIENIKSLMSKLSRD